MTTPATTAPAAPAKWGSDEDWAEIVKGAASGAQSALKSPVYGSGKKDAKESKRRTLANVLNNALNRKHKTKKEQKTHKNEMTDFKNQVLQHAARNFSSALQGSSVNK